jgi:hypothetical protein
MTLIKIEFKNFNEINKVFKKDYYNKLKKIIKYFIILKRFKSILKNTFRSFLKNVLKYVIIKN